jgi:deferrochelatase/peroxidase EfeB
MVGRWPNGAPLVLSPDRSDEKLAGHDDFFYAQDPSGLACPIGSHIRRTNPRDHLRPAGRSESLRMTARHRLLRRGSSYGPPLFDLRLLDRTEDAESLRGILDLKDDGRDRGLHFLCVNASVKSQFEFVEQAWINNPRANGLVDEPDPVSGNSEHAGEKPGMLRIPGCPAGIRTSPLPRFVTVRGGTYLFMPGLTALRFLSDSGVASK